MISVKQRKVGGEKCPSDHLGFGGGGKRDLEKQSKYEKKKKEHEGNVQKSRTTSTLNKTGFGQARSNWRAKGHAQEQSLGKQSARNPPTKTKPPPPNHTPHPQ